MNEEQFKLSLIQQLRDKSPGVLSLLQKYRTFNRKRREYHFSVNFIDRDLSLEIAFNRLSEASEMPNYAVSFKHLSEKDALNPDFFKKADLSSRCIRLFYEESITIENGIISFGVYECRVYRDGYELKVARNIVTTPLYYNVNSMCFYYPEEIDSIIEKTEVLRKTCIHYGDLVIDDALKTNFENLLSTLKPESNNYRVIDGFYRMLLSNLTVVDGSFFCFCLDDLRGRCQKK